MGIFSGMKSRMLAALAKVAAVIATTGKDAGIDIKTVTDSINAQTLAQPYIYVGRGKGGKKQAHRQTGAAAIKRAAKKARNRKRSK